MVRAVDNAAHAAQGPRGRHKSHGPTFTLPSLPCTDTSAAASTVTASTEPAVVTETGKLGQTASVSAAAAKVATPAELVRYVGHSVGSGQCVALAKAVQPDLGPTSHWRGGDNVQGNTSLQPGTVIATFNKASRYANALDGSSHAAIYLGQNAHGLQVLDQWAGKAASVRTIPWSHRGAVAANTGNAFRVVLTG